jgi:hypothetical protein
MFRHDARRESDCKMIESKYLEFAKQPKRKTQKTWVTDVTSRSGGMLLGQIKWYGAWRQYAFYPSTDKVTIFNVECMSDITKVIQELMAERARRATA